jgi:hypothetical protein
VRALAALLGCPDIATDARQGICRKLARQLRLMSP